MKPGNPEKEGNNTTDTTPAPKGKTLSQINTSSSANNRGKSLESIMNQQMRQRYRYRDNEKFSGAIKKDKHVLALDRKGQW